MGSVKRNHSRLNPFRDRPEAQAELRRIYAACDELFALRGCDTSTRCCRFGLTGREPYVTRIEVAVLQAAITATDQEPRRPTHRPLPLAGGPVRDAARGDGACPMLVDGACSVYDARPLGCRTFFCHRATGASVPHRKVRQLVREIEDLDASVDGRRLTGRPLRSALGERARKGS